MVNDEIYQNEFIWNRDKKALNLKIHHVSFEMGAESTKDLYAIEDYDEMNSIFEDRYNVIGLYQGSRLLTVSVTYREFKRIFSVRDADEEETKDYDRHLRECFRS
jgi:uncharacterized DUF497 family protein